MWYDIGLKCRLEPHGGLAHHPRTRGVFLSLIGSSTQFSAEE